MIKEFKDEYNIINKLYCPYFRDYVYFTRIGYEHIFFKKKFKARNALDSKMRVKMFPLAVKLLNATHTIQDIQHRNRFEIRYINSRKEVALVSVVYYEFIAVIDGRKIKTVLKQIIGGNIIFLSIIPLLKQKSPPFEGDGFG
jgi:hypothetical protein